MRKRRYAYVCKGAGEFEIFLLMCRTVEMGDLKGRTFSRIEWYYVFVFYSTRPKNTLYRIVRSIISHLHTCIRNISRLQLSEYSRRGSIVPCIDTYIIPEYVLENIPSAISHSDGNYSVDGVTGGCNGRLKVVSRLSVGNFNIFSYSTYIVNIKRITKREVNRWEDCNNKILH